MPKMKTHKGAKKRLRRTASGKLKRNSAFTNHLFANKTQKQKRKLRKAAVLKAADQGRFKKMSI